MATTSLLQLIENCATAARWRLSDTCSAAGTSSTFTLGAVDSPVDEIDAASLYEHAWAFVEADSAVTPLNVGEVRRIKAFTPSTAGFTLASGRTFSNATTTTQTIGVYKTVPPDAGGGTGDRVTWKQYINRVLRSVRYRRYTLLTLVTDGDMETSGASNWTASNSTLTKSTTSTYIALGAQSLRVQNSSANGYARSALIPVAAGDQYAVAAQLNADSGTAHLVAYDETNSAEIDSESTALRDWRSLDFTFTVPGGCHSLSVRLKGAESDADVYWDNVSLRPTQARRLDLPSWVDSEQCVEGLYEVRPHSVQGDAYMVASQLKQPLVHYRVLSDATGATPYRAQFRFLPLASSLLFVRGLSAYAELSALTNTTVADPDLVLAGACLEAGITLNDKNLIREFEPKWKARAARLPRRETLLPGVW